METTNHEYYVSLEVAKLLKQAGFDWEIYDGYIIYEDGAGFTIEFQSPHNFNGDNCDLFINYGGHKEVLSRPTLDVAQRWLREVKEIEVNTLCVYINNVKKYSYSVFEGKYNNERIEEGFDTYEEAQEAGIKKALEIIL